MLHSPISKNDFQRNNVRIVGLKTSEGEDCIKIASRFSRGGMKILAKSKERILTENSFAAETGIC